ncbi:hypothetical protein M409DRAFT_30997 [Zasmidium cellare ATCC 36951]|uniref:FAD-binding domain-containing protein n=1 Tax=Zasmidium cellare ATCC 36951 TaxID=1080233 RepID=A0A6A6BWS9_ZASCE|nr:uncharacterized protein M409DRAFT_30997 [Zasmidium cellare ATCC 36951]KAF2158498.1 hypothetical protein M409DRAFT_30997 [Zasmidium cellare ATCC 36951]
MPLTAIIVGAGIGGLATAVALRQADIEVTILEKRTTIEEVGYAIDVPPNATRILKHFGMDMTKLRGCHQKSLDVFKADVEPMEAIRSESRDIGDDAPFLSVHRVDYHEALRDLAVDPSLPRKPAQLRCNSRVVAYNPSLGSVSLASGDVIHADVIVAADGNNSKAHTWIVGEEHPARATGLNNVRFTIPSTVMLEHHGMKQLVENTKDRMCVYIDSVGNFIAHYACRDHTLQNFGLYHEDPPDDHSTTTRKKKEIAWQRLGHINSTFASITALVEEDGTYLWQIVDRDPLERLHSGSLVLVGDASHPMQPKMGQGAAQAVEDAAVLGAVLKGVESKSAIPSRLKLWEELRRPRASAIQLMSRTDPSHDGWPNQEDKEKAARFFPHGDLPLTRAEMAAWAFKYDAVAEAHEAFKRPTQELGTNVNP